MNNINKRTQKLISLLSLLCLTSSGFAPRALAREHHHRKKEATDTNFAPCLSWLVPKPRAVLLCVHGLGLDSSAYATFASKMQPLDISCYAIDVRGFGSWMRAAGHEQVDFDACLEDVRQALTSIRAANPGVPVFLVGESMGGAIALHGAAHFPELIDGVISSVPAAERFQEKRTDLKVALAFLKGPRKDFDIGSSIVDQATNNEKLRAAWEADPLSRMNLSPHELLQFQRFMNSNHEIAKDITLPTLMLQGTMDRLVKPAGSFDLFEHIKSQQKIFIALPSEHLILEEQKAHTEKFDDRVAALLIGWINANVAMVIADKTPAKPVDKVAKYAPTDKSEIKTETKTEPKGKDPVAQVLLSGSDKAKDDAAKVSDATALTNDAAKAAALPPVTDGNAATAHEAMQKEQKILDTAIGGMQSATADFDPMEREMSLALMAMRAGRFNDAQKLLQAIVQTEPLNADAHYWLALALVNDGKAAEAKKEKELAKSLAKLAGRTKQVKNYVLDSNNLLASQNAEAVNPKDLTKGLPTVLIFEAGWCAECQGIDGIVKQAQLIRGKTVRFLSFDVDNKDNIGLVKLFNIGPIPTFVFLNADGTTSSTVIGRATLPSIQRELQNIAPRTKE